MSDTIAEVDLSKADLKAYSKHLTDCVVITHDGKLLMQQRPDDYGRFGGCLNLFGGHVEGGETALQGLCRELKEELGADVNPDHVVFLGAVTEDFTGHTELVHIHVWRDVHGTITGCYECEAIEYGSMADALAHPKLMHYARWALLKTVERGASVEAALRHASFSDNVYYGK